MSNSIRIDGQIIKVGDKFADWELIKVNSKPGGQYGEPSVKATFKKGNSTKNIEGISYYDGKGLREALGVPAAAMPKSQNNFKKMFPAAASVFGWGGKRPKTHRRKLHKRSTRRRRN